MIEANPSPIAITRFDVDQKNVVNLVVMVTFKVIPLRVLSQRVSFQLYFDSKLLQEKRLSISNVFAKKELSVQAVMDLETVRSGPHTVKIALRRIYPISEPAESVSREETFTYDSKTMLVGNDALDNAPKILSIGEVPPVDVVDEKSQKFYEEMEKRRRREIALRRGL
jgi:hypothetical protein